jgi:pilus assembly protein FimV
MMLWYSVPGERVRVRSVAKSVTGIRVAVAALLLAPLLAYSAGLGRLTVKSALGQPLNAEIEIVAVQSGEEDSVTARLASPEAFRQAGIDLSSALLGVQFAIDKRGSAPVIRLTTVQPVNEPFLDVLVELQWATGRLVREYTFLLDPPEYKGPVPAAAPAAAVRPVPAPAPAPAVAVPPAAARPIPAAPAAPAAAAGKHEVKKGDTLGAIARANLPPGVTLNQMLIALFRANQDAFIRGNVNLVRAGRILNIPDREAVAAVGAAEANKLVQSQIAEFVEYKRKLAAAVAAAPATPAPVREREVSGRIAPKPEAAAPAEPKKDQLKLSKAEPSKPGAPASRAAREDDRVARERALKESQSRVGDLEKNVVDLQKLLEMKNQQLAELEKKAGAKPAPAPAAPAPAAKAPEPAKPAAAPAPAAKAPEPAKPAAAPEKPAAEVPKPAAETPKPAAEAPKPATKEAPKEAAKPAPGAPKAKAAPKPAESSLIDEVMSFLTDPISGGGLAVVLLMLGGYGYWAWRRKKASQSQFQDSVLGAATGPGAGSVFAAAAQPAAVETPQPAAAAGGVSEVSVSGVSVGAESDEVDPIAEADVYMAYGRDAQAEEILKEALGKDANRVAVHAKLLEIYANRKDAKSFEQTALKVKSLTNGAGPEWDKAMALGHSIDPGNGLYGSGGAAAEAAAAPAAAPAAAAPTLDFDIGGGAEPAAAGAEAKPESAGLDFDLGATAPAAKKSDFAKGGTLIIDTKDVQEQQAAGSGLDFDLGGAGGDDGEKTMLLTPKKPAEAPKADPDATVAMDFDLNIDLGGAKTEPAKPVDAPLDLGGISLDLGAPGGGAAAGGADPKWQEVATKLDLAKAYQEMGDKDGARELLNEVVKEGDAAQQDQAKQMLAGLG